MTRKRVSDDQYGQLQRRLYEVARRVDEGAVPFDYTMSALQLILEGDIPVPAFKRDMAKEAGWTLESDVGFNPAISKVSDLERVEFFFRTESFVSGTELEERARKLNANLGQKHAEWLLEHQDKVPESWRGTYLIFPGTVWRRGGGRSAPYLHWSGGQWCLRFGWLDGRFGSGGRLVRLSK